jgi:hypothetical protein
MLTTVMRHPVLAAHLADVRDLGAQLLFQPAQQAAVHRADL